MTPRTSGSFRFAFTAGACLLLLPLKLIRGWAAAPAPLLVSSWVADSCFLFLLCSLGIWAGGSRPVRRALLGGLVLVGLELPAFVTITAHTYFLEDATGRRFSLLDLTPATVQYFLVHVVERRALWAGIAAVLALAAAAFVVSRRTSRPPAKPALLTLGALTAAVLVHQAWCQPYPSVVWEVARDVRDVYAHPAVSGSTHSRDLEDAGTGRVAAWPERSPFDKVIVFVMESVPLRELETRMRELPADHFFNRERAHTRAYVDYFTTNQDSRTGMMSMLFSRLVPFEAYVEADVDRYVFLRDEHSLVDDMRARGYTTVYAESQIDEEVVVFDLPSWTDRLLLTDQEYNNRGAFLCFNPYEFEKDCEDKIILPRIFKVLDAHERLFLFQEAIYGHNGQYEDTMDKSPVQYYGEYLQALQDHLAARGELDRTLFVITSDHGIRSWDGATRRWVYRLPLLLINPRFTHEERAGLYSQSDFAALLAAEMAGVAPPKPRAVSLFVGYTNSSLVGGVTAEGDLLVVRDGTRFKYVVADGYCPGNDRPVEKPRRALSSAALVERFHQLREAFRPGMGPAPRPQPAAGQH